MLVFELACVVIKISAAIRYLDGMKLSECRVVSGARREEMFELAEADLMLSPWTLIEVRFL